jgi:hypothetical protein
MRFFRFRMGRWIRLAIRLLESLLTPEDLEVRRAKQREYQRRHRACRSRGKIEAVRARDRERYRALAAEQRERRLADIRLRHQRLTVEKREKKRMRDRA